MTDMRRPSGCSIRVSSSIRKRVGDLAVLLKATSQQEVIDRALNQLEHTLFWEGFEEEAKAYLAAYPQELRDRKRYGGTSADGMKGLSRCGRIESRIAAWTSPQS
jgi:hypothetical protein